MDVVDTTSRHQVAKTPAGSEDRFRALIEKSPDAITLLIADGTVLYVSPSTSRITGYGSDELIGRSGFDFLHPDDLARAKGLLADLLQKPGQHIMTEVRLHHKDGSWRWVEAIGTNLLGSPDVNAIVANYHDVTERKRMQEALKNANDKLTFWARELERRNRELSLLSEMGGLLQACVSEREAYHVIARSAPELFPEGSGAVYIVDHSKSLAEALAVWGKNSTGELVFPLNDCWALRRGRIHAVEGTDLSLFCQHLRRRPPAASLCVPMVAQGEILGVLHLYFGAHDVRLADPHRHMANTVADHLSLALGNLRLRERLRSQSIRDPLTGFYNRHMEEFLGRECGGPGVGTRRVAVIMLELDHFKSNNDTLGHEAGDAALVFAGRLSPVARPPGGRSLSLRRRGICPHPAGCVARRRSKVGGADSAGCQRPPDLTSLAVAEDSHSVPGSGGIPRPRLDQRIPAARRRHGPVSRQTKWSRPGRGRLESRIRRDAGEAAQITASMYHGSRGTASTTRFRRYDAVAWTPVSLQMTSPPKDSI